MRRSSSAGSALWNSLILLDISSSLRTGAALGYRNFHARFGLRRVLSPRVRRMSRNSDCEKNGLRGCEQRRGEHRVAAVFWVVSGGEQGLRSRRLQTQFYCGFRHFPFKYTRFPRLLPVERSRSTGCLWPSPRGSSSGRDCGHGATTLKFKI